MLIPPTTSLPTRTETALRHKAEDLESTFLSQMLSHAGFDSANEAMGAGDDAAQFTSFLRDSLAEAMVSRGGLGLTESLFTALVARAGGEKNDR